MEQDRKFRINPQTYGHIIFDKLGENIQWRKDILFNKLCWENWTATSKKHYFPDLEPVNCSMSRSNCFFLTYSFLRRQVKWSGIPISKTFP